MGLKITNIPKSTIRQAAMGDTDYKVSNKNTEFEKSRIKKVRYYSTSDRLTRAQILVLLDMHRHIDSKGYGIEIKIRTLSESTHLTMQCVNKCIGVLERKGFIAIGIKEYGYLNYYIDTKQGYSKDENTGGYYQMDNDLMEYLLKIKSVDELRLALIGLLEDDFSRKRNKKTIISHDSLRKIIPSSAHPKARKILLKKAVNSPYSFSDREEGVHFTLRDVFYGKITAKKITAETNALFEKLKAKEISFNSKDTKDIQSLCHEYGTDSVSDVLLNMELDMMQTLSPLGAYIRTIIKTA